MSNSKGIPEIPDLEYPKVGVEHKEHKKRTVRPWDILNKNIEKVADDIKNERLSICLECPRLIKATKQCKECGCFMDLKTRLFEADCPLGKWGPVRVDRNNFDYRKA